jgi:hypothetical protein
MAIAMAARECEAEMTASEHGEGRSGSRAAARQSTARVS